MAFLSVETTVPTRRTNPAAISGEGAFFRRFMNHSLQALHGQLHRLVGQAAGTATAVEASEQPEAIAYTLGIIAVATRLMAVDGDINPMEEQAFHACFPMPEVCADSVRYFMAEARRDTADIGFYARQWRVLYPEHTRLYRQTVERLLQLALADRALERGELLLICRAAEALALPLPEWEALWEAQFRLPEVSSSLYARWGWARAERDEWWRQLQRQQFHYHPDRWLNLNDSAYGLLACRVLNRYAAALNGLLSNR